MIEAACTPGWSQKYHHFANLTGDAIRSQLHGGESSYINVYISQHIYQAEKIRIQKQKKESKRERTILIFFATDSEEPGV